MKKFIILLTLLAVGKLYTQDLKLSYILPDIGAPGMNTYVEFFAPVDSLNEFGDDNFYLNNFDSPVRIEYVNPEDSNKVVFGPVVVSWEGRLITTQAFVHPFVEPDAQDWTDISPEFKIPIRINFNGRVSNVDTFYIVREFYLGDISGQPESVFGEGNLGRRSRRGAMIVDSLVLGDKRYTVSTNDCDPYSDGNQGFLPFVLISRGSIRGTGPSSEIDVSADGRHGGPGGGKFCDDVFG